MCLTYNKMGSYIPDLGLTADTWTLVLGLVVFVLVRYFVRRHIKLSLEQKSEVTPKTVQDKVTVGQCKSITVGDSASCDKATCCRSAESVDDPAQHSESSGPLVILYGTTTGTARQLSGQLAAGLLAGGLAAVTVRDCAEFGKNVDEEFAAYAKSRTRLVRYWRQLSAVSIGNRKESIDKY